MLAPSQLAQAAARLARAASRPANVIVFGSYARGDAANASDLGLRVIEPELPDKAQEYLRLKAAVGRLGVMVDLLLLSQADFDRRSQIPDTLAYWARKEGKVLHAPAH